MKKTRSSAIAAITAGFTLIELLVVVAIISLLIAMLMPALGRARDAARQSQCLAQLHQIGVGVITYIENDNKAMLFNYGTGKTTHMSHIYYQGYFTSHYPQLGVASKAESLFHCPAHPWPVNHANAWMRTSANSMSNSHYGWPMDYRNHLPIMARTGEPVRTTELPSHSRAILMAETAYNNPTRRNRGEGASYFGVYNTPGEALIPDKHLGSGNYGFLDGHAASYQDQYIYDHAKADPSSPVRFSWPAGSY